jgi:hypothetical protein
MGAFGIGPAWLSVDANWTWSKPELLDKPVLVRILGIRLGHTFTFKNRPDRNVAFWIGGFRMQMQSETVGQISLRDALPQEFWDNKDEKVDNYWDWYNSLGNGPVDQKKKEVADQVLTPIVDRIDARDGSAVVRYGMDKRVAEVWNGVIGAQFQLNKAWMLRTEWGLIGNRKSILASLNYRFKI